jgi:hypothetical protein
MNVAGNARAAIAVRKNSSGAAVAAYFLNQFRFRN